MVWDGPESGFRGTTFGFPNMGTEEVLVETRMTTLCGSDLHTVRGERRTPLPTILGHETVGRVVGTGSEHVQDLNGDIVEPGMRIVWTIGVSCGACRKCNTGLPQKCLWLRKYGHERVTQEWALNGGLSTHCHLLPGTGLVLVPEEVPDVAAVPASCATATAACAVRRVGNLTGTIVAVLGCGMLGLTIAAYALYAGAESVIACDPDANRRALARGVGATHATTPGELREVLLELSDGEGAAAVFEMSGDSGAVEQALSLLATGGTAALVGSVSPSPGITLEPESVVRQMKTIIGTHNYAPQDLRDAVRFLKAKPYGERLAGLVQVVGGLGDTERAFTCAAEPSARPRMAIAPE